MLLIDAIYINQGGGFVLLRYLLDVLKERNIEFFLLADSRCIGKLNDVTNIQYMSASLRGRWKFYTRISENITSILCFGNVPPPVKMDVPVYTYFHNINMLTLADCKDRRQKIMYWLKRTYIKSKKANTDKWFVQTSNTEHELVQNLKVGKSVVELYPFYKIPNFIKTEAERTDYIFVGEDSGSKGHRELIDAWEILNEKGYKRTLHLTVSPQSSLYAELQTPRSIGLGIINHGFIPLDEVFRLYAKCQATVYPSRNESFGLGIIEALEAGCDVIASDLPYVHAICAPSEVFDRRNPASIAGAVIRYEAERIKSHKTVVDKLNDMIDLIVVSS